MLGNLTSGKTEIEAATAKVRIRTPSGQQH